MIRINLLPDDRKAQKKIRQRGPVGPGIAPLVIIFLVAVYCGVVGFAVFKLYLPYTDAKKELAGQKTKRSAKQDEVDTQRALVKDLAEIEREARTTLEVLNVLDPPDRLYWSEMLNRFSDLKPEGVYISKITLSEKVTETETAASIKARKDWKANKTGDRGLEPKKAMRSHITQTLVLSGLSYVTAPTPEQVTDIEIAKITEFQAALEDSLLGQQEPSNGDADRQESILNLKKIDFSGSMMEDDLGGRQVTVFEFSIVTNPLLNEKEQETNDNVANGQAAAGGQD